MNLKLEKLSNEFDNMKDDLKMLKIVMMTMLEKVTNLTQQQPNQQWDNNIKFRLFI